MEIKTEILPSEKVREDGTFDKDSSLNLAGKIAGVCYDPEGFDHISKEPVEKTNKRIERTIKNGHHSVYDHAFIKFNFINIPKILAMVLNNEHQYTTSEKSGRYTNVTNINDDLITADQKRLYDKWFNIFKIKIKERYGNVFSDFKIKTLAQENARNLITVFYPTQMVYTTSLRQINYIASWMNEYVKEIEDKKKNNTATFFEIELSKYMKQFLEQLDEKNVLEKDLMGNEKHRKISLFQTGLESKKDYFSDVYQTTYDASFAHLAQAQRHRTIDYRIEIPTDNLSYVIPPILEDDKALTQEWLRDIESVGKYYPNGTLIKVFERGKYEDFILKCKERLCTDAQLDIMLQTKKTLEKYRDALKENNDPLYDDIVNYTHGARCTFKDFDGKCDCKFKEGKTLDRKI